MDNLSIKIVIGNRSYPMKVPINEEQKIRKIGKELNNKISEVKKQMNIDDLQDVLAMIAFKLSVLLEENKNTEEDSDKDYKNKDHIISEIDKGL